MRKKAVLLICVLFYANVVPIFAETPEITEARIAGENDAKGFKWKWFAMSYFLSNASPVLGAATMWVIDSKNTFDLNRFDPVYCLAVYGFATALSTSLTLTYSATPPSERLLGKSPEWINAYAKAYQRTVKKHRLASSYIGCFVGSATLATTFLLIADYFRCSCEMEE